jgi:hypothetical protein
MNIHAKGSFSI